MTEFLRTRKGRIVVISAAVVLIAAIVLIILLLVGGETGYRNISVSKVSGRVIAENNGNEYEAYENMRLAGGYALNTGTESYTRLSLDDDKYVKLEQESRAEFRNVGDANKHITSIYLAYGALTAELVNPLAKEENFVINTPNAALAVRGTFYRVKVSFDETGDVYTDVYTYGGAVVCQRIMPDGTVVDEEVVISQGYKARIKMDEIITIYIEELIEYEPGDDVDPINVDEISDSDIVDMYNASFHGHGMFLGTVALWQEILDRDIDLSEYYSAYDMGEIEEYVVTSGPEEEQTEVSTAASESFAATTTTIATTTTATAADSEYTSETTAADTAEEAADGESTGGIGADETAADTSAAAASSAHGIATVPAVTTTVTAAVTEEPVVTVPSITEEPEKSDEANTSEAVSDTVSQSEEPAETVTTDADITSAAPRPEATASSGTFTTSRTGEPAVNTTSAFTPQPAESTVNSTSAPKPAESSSSSSSSEPEPAESSSSSSSSEPEPDLFDGLLYTEDGSITITETGYTQGTGREIAYTGAYIISQRDRNTVTEGFYLTVESGTHRISLNNINVSGEQNIITVQPYANVYFSGSYDNIISASLIYSYAFNNQGVTTFTDLALTPEGIRNSGTLLIRGNSSLKIKRAILNENGGIISISDGSVDVSDENASAGINNGTGCTLAIEGGKVFVLGGQHGIRNYGSMTVAGGLVTVQTAEPVTGCYDISTDTPVIVKGGSLRLINDLLDGSAVNVYGDKLECVVYEVYPSEDLRTFEGPSGYSYVYALSEGNRAEDGKYYVWKPVKEEVEPEPDGIAINDVNFPDHVFREYVSDNFDKDNDGYLSEEECEAVTTVNIGGTSSRDGGITSLKGIEHFVNLESLYCYYNSGLTSLDVRNNTALTSLNCDNTGITELDVSNNTMLTDLTCSSSGITALDVRNNTALTNLYCNNTGITELNVSNNTLLDRLYCYSTEITDLDVSNNTALTYLWCFDTEITKLDVSKNTDLAYLYCHFTRIATLDVRNNAALIDLQCHDTNITSLDVSNNTALKTLYCYDTEITTLNVSNNTALVNLQCYNTEITELDVSNNNALFTLYCQNCNLAYVDISSNSSISTFTALGNTYPIPSNATTFDTRTDPNFAGFNPSKVSTVTNAVFEDGVFTNITGDIIYTYNCGQGYFVTFMLTRTAPYSLEAPDLTVDIPDSLPESLLPPDLMLPEGDAAPDTDGIADVEDDQESSGDEFDISDPSESLANDEGEAEPDADSSADLIEDPGGSTPDSGDEPVEDVLALARGRPPDEYQC